MQPLAQRGNVSENQTAAGSGCLKIEGWADEIRTLLLKRFPGLTEEQITEGLAYSDLSAPIETKKDKDRWQSVLTSLDQLKLVTPVPAVAGGPLRNTSIAPSERVTTPWTHHRLLECLPL